MSRLINDERDEKTTQEMSLMFEGWRKFFIGIIKQRVNNFILYNQQNRNNLTLPVKPVN